MHRKDRIEMYQGNDAVISWLKERAIPLTALDPQAPLDDLAPFEQIVGNASIVALGEASHGGHEFFVMKHRLLRFYLDGNRFAPRLARFICWICAQSLSER